MRLPGYDFKNPNVGEVFRARAAALERIRKDPSDLPHLREWYKHNPADFIEDWGCTYDPRLISVGKPAIMPFVLFDKQRDFIHWAMDKWRNGDDGIAEKSRDCGISWVCIAWACAMCLHWEGMSFGFGSRKEEYVDKAGQPKSLFWKARKFMELLPIEFRGGWQPWHAPHMRIHFPQTGAVITGEAGDQIGRGDRQAVYIVDESAFLERPELVDSALSQTTHCRIDVSTVNGMANPFAQRRHSGKIDVFVFDWRDDPRKDQEWYDGEVERLDEKVVAQEIDRDYMASVDGVVIPGKWARAALDAHKLLGIKPTGERGMALDLADEGEDKNAACGAHGVVVDLIEEWSGKGSDTFATAQRAFDLADDYVYPFIRFDSDGLGAGFRGDARVLNEMRVQKGRRPLRAEPFRGSAAVYLPESEDVKGRKNKDYFANAKAQGWWALRRRFQNVYRWRELGIACDPDEIISIDTAKVTDWQLLLTELSQPTYKTGALGKIVIDKTPDGVKSPNRADAVMIRFAPVSRPLVIPDGAMERVRFPARQHNGRNGRGGAPGRR